jgi:hypothetical protein
MPREQEIRRCRGRLTMKNPPTAVGGLQEDLVLTQAREVGDHSLQATCRQRTPGLQQSPTDPGCGFARRRPPLTIAA